MIWILACNGGQDDETKPTDTGGFVVETGPHDYLVEDTTITETTFSDAEVAAAIDEAIVVFQDLDAWPVIDAYDQVVAHAEEGCPAWYSNTDGPYWFDNCTTSTGARFEGYGTRISIDKPFVDGEMTWNSGGAVGSVGRISTDEGDLEMNGYVYVLEGISTEGVSQEMTIIDGDVTWTGKTGDNWLASGIKPTINRVLYEVGGYRGVTVSGSVTGLSGAVDTVAFDNVFLVDADTGYSDCDLEPSGVISVRLTSGLWVDLIFDVVGNEEGGLTAEAGECDGCASAWHNADYLGEACADFSPWIDG